MTEDEAKTKRCPGGAGEVVMIEGHGYDGPRLRVFGAKCVASECMAWRWTIAPGAEESAQRYARSSKPFTASGYCGLARHDQ